MPLDTAARRESGPEHLTAHEARQRLEHERASRLVQLTAIEEAGPGANDQVMAVQKDALQRVLKAIDAAFDRLENGTYGICQDCAQPIPVQRLEILPYARCCVGCQRRTT
ncbi:molecular chaperone DnaK [Streptomyces agglomeratus]|uniref:Molecular chaperone DnaK n=1 Tax=Streptomyces agglomeratus TaxID=285458 RepID=A0A1E5PH18_9ACTN|nr:TraR/DksA C4-type zinc finger protein [Streptomyces agglomeratus]OEJ28858.1 molecular chaperone DnaK [Streptomyces agglomeratus]OEJ37058.1 molecular chaperone DnaK [Streptomyces agglomeratus]OEJ48411.1 molecular chaperone DnaK [Streptomyces agglomeratus]OEJ49457.1 molecular chaperone DnaK [Streptomyces agglomeratus]OEJ56909.1 molecular chaperone DnaK [Streptomyces agglomeratus]